MPQILSSTFSGALTASQALSWGGDLFLRRDAANTLAQRNGVNPQTFNIYNTFTDASNYELGQLTWSANTFFIGTAAAGTGTGRNLGFSTSGVGRWTITSSGNLISVSDGSYDIGGSGAGRARNVYAAGYYASGYTTQSGTTYTIGTSDSTVILTAASTVTLTLPAAASFVGRVIRLKTTGGGSVVSATSNVVPKAGGAAGTAILAATAGTWCELQSDATNWIVIAGT